MSVKKITTGRIKLSSQPSNALIKIISSRRKNGKADTSQNNSLVSLKFNLK
jgi:hypothetical protein